MTELWLTDWPVLGVTAPASGTKSALRKRRINPVLRISDLFMSGTSRQNELFPVDGLLVFPFDIVVNNIVMIPKVIFYNFWMHRLNHLVHLICLVFGAPW
jgi:hypothetical protein